MLAPKEEVVPFPPLYRRVRVEGPDVDGDYEYYGASQKAAIYFCRAKRLFIQKIDREWILFKPDVDNRPEQILAKSDAHGSINSATKLEDPPHDKWTSSLRFSQLPSVTSIAALRNRVADSKEYFRSIFGDSADNPQLMRCLGRFDGVPVGTLREPVVALLGRAGSGKSTLLNALLGDKLLPANKERIAATQTSVDLMVDPHVAEYTVRVRFVGRERWRARRSALVRSVLQRDEDSAEDGAAEACEDKAEAADILELLYGAQRSKDEAFLAKLEQLPPEEDDPNPAIAQALRDGTRVTQHGFVESMRELLFQLVAVPKRNAPEAEKQRALFPVVEKVWVSGPFPKAIVPAGMHVVDVPGVQDVSRDREAVARAAIESATLVLITASGAATAERPFVSAMIRNEIDSAKRRGQQCVLVLTGSDKFFKKKEETARARIESDIEEARRRGIDVPIVHTAARSYFKKEGNPSPPTRYGASLLVPYMQEELQRVTARVPELFGLWEQAWRASVEEWQQLTISPPSGSPASKASSGTQSPSHKAAADSAAALTSPAPTSQQLSSSASQPVSPQPKQPPPSKPVSPAAPHTTAGAAVSLSPARVPEPLDWRAAEKELVVAMQPIFRSAEAAVDVLIRSLREQKTVVVPQWIQTIKQRTERLAWNTLRTLFERGGRFHSSSAGLIDLPALMLEPMLSAGGLDASLRGLLDAQLPMFFSQIESAFSAQLASLRRAAGIPADEADDARAGVGLRRSLGDRLAQLRTNIDSVLLTVLRELIAPGLKPESGSGCRLRMLSNLSNFLQSRAGDVFDHVVGSLNARLCDDVKRLEAVAQEQARARSIALRDLASSLLSRATSPPVARSLPQPSPAWTSVGEIECELNYDNPVTGRVQGCVCKPYPKVCYRCFLRLLNTAQRSQVLCPYCRQPYDLKVGYREGNFSIHSA